MFIIHTPRGAVVTILFSIIIFTIQKLLTQGVGRKKLITTIPVRKVTELLSEISTF